MEGERKDRIYSRVLPLGEHTLLRGEHLLSKPLPVRLRDEGIVHRMF